MDGIPKNIALVYDRVNKWGGAERVLLALHDLFPHAPLFTSVYEKETAGWAKIFPEVVPTFLQKLPFVSKHHELFPFLMPIAFESLSFSEFDAVISVTSADAKGIVTSPGTFHLCYCLTPTRYLWSHHEEYKNELNPILKYLSNPLFKYLKYWDLQAAKRPDAIVSISQTVQTRVKKYYGLDSPVVYPPVDISRFKKKVSIDTLGVGTDYFLYVGRLVRYKRADVVVRAFAELGLPLVVAGSGSYLQELQNLSGPKTKFVGQVTESELVYLYQNCRCLVFLGDEDFGIVPVEAQAAGKPVIGLNRGGTSETVIDQVTGILLPDDSVDTLISAIRNFLPGKFDRNSVIRQSHRFSLERFNREFVKVLHTKWQTYQSIYMS